MFKNTIYKDLSDGHFLNLQLSYKACLYLHAPFIPQMIILWYKDWRLKTTQVKTALSMSPSHVSDSTCISAISPNSSEEIASESQVMNKYASPTSETNIETPPIWHQNHIPHSNSPLCLSNRKTLKWKTLPVTNLRGGFPWSSRCLHTTLGKSFEPHPGLTTCLCNCPRHLLLQVYHFL